MNNQLHPSTEKKQQNGQITNLSSANSGLTPSQTWQSKLDRYRKEHPNAYRPWSAEDDKKLTDLFNQGSTTEDLMDEFGRHRGAIRSRLVKLELIEGRKKKN